MSGDKPTPPQTLGECLLLLLGGAVFAGAGVALLRFVDIGGFLPVVFLFPIFVGGILLVGAVAGFVGMARRARQG
jgi:hypothetical protein